MLQFEVEIQKITDAYESLVKHSTKRENLDKVMRLRLETEVKKLRENNQDLKGNFIHACYVKQSPSSQLENNDANQSSKSTDFIELIHPIQWTIALPVGVTSPAKCQKKTSCIYYRQAWSWSVH